ncbi:MAG: aminotransferase class I/II-fold pyridoxal phosphate-dependent enzyme, partial [Leptolyngbya sp. SIO1D8]|nr:aminotransferase class I/II-fold pyridoxal phosphate-dependent enzyme [Leptolyngbya sp. SIO1D8]
MNFSKSFKAPAPIPPQGIVNAIRLMESSQLYRYNFDLDITENTDIASLDNELASEVAKLEVEFSRYTGHKYVVAVNSCGSALFLALKALEIPYRNKVFTNAFTFTAVPSSIVHAGGTPVYLECDHQYLIDIDDLENKIQANPDAKHMIVSHMRGHVSDMDAIQAICREADLTLIEDCAHSLGAEWCDKTSGQSRMIGHHGKIACFSSQSYKHLNSGEGGFIATNDEKIAAYCILGAGSYEDLYRKHLSRPFDDTLFETLKPHVPNFSLRMSNLTAVVLRPQITQLEEKIAKCNLLYKTLMTTLAPARNIYIPSPLEQVT